MTGNMVLQLINILTLGNPQGIGGFFPVGLNGAIKTPTGYNLSASGLQPYGASAQTVEVSMDDLDSFDSQCIVLIFSDIALCLPLQGLQSVKVLASWDCLALHAEWVSKVHCLAGRSLHLSQDVAAVWAQILHPACTLQLNGNVCCPRTDGAVKCRLSNAECITCFLCRPFLDWCRRPRHRLEPFRDLSQLLALSSSQASLTSLRVRLALWPMLAISAADMSQPPTNNHVWAPAQWWTLVLHLAPQQRQQPHLDKQHAGQGRKFVICKLAGCRQESSDRQTASSAASLSSV